MGQGVQLQRGKCTTLHQIPTLRNFDLPGALPLGPSLEHAPSVPQGVGSDKLIKDVRTIMYLVCLVVLECCSKEYGNCPLATIDRLTVCPSSVRL
jgi:hypothetical protein